MRILFLQNRMLFPTDTGGKIRTLNILRYLAAHHEITYLCALREGEAEHLPRMRAIGLRTEPVPFTPPNRGSWRYLRDVGLSAFSKYPFTISRNFHHRIRARTAELLRDEPFDLLICDFVQMARHALGLPLPASVLFQHNVEAQIFQRHAQADHGWLRRRYMALQWRRMQRFEAGAGRAFDRVIAVSPQDRQTFERDYGWRHVDVIDTAVDLDFFQPRAGAERPDRVLFLGSLDWMPNQNGVHYFVEHIWQRVRALRPQARFQVVGRNPSPAVQRLGELPGVEVVGSVPDVRPYLAEAAVVVVPLRVGGGTRLKIFEAMAMKKAVVSTTIGAEGLPVDPGTHLELADEPNAFADAVATLLACSERRQQIGATAFELVRARYGAEKIARQFEDICQDVVDRRTVQHRRSVRRQPAVSADVGRVGSN